MCGTFVDEVPQEFQKERKAVAELSLEATEQAFPTVQAVMADDANADFNPEAAEALLGLFQGRVTQRPLFMTGCARPSRQCRTRVPEPVEVHSHGACRQSEIMDEVE